jgi:hypothetical protein
VERGNDSQLSQERNEGDVAAALKESPPGGPPARRPARAQPHSE